MFLKEIFIHKTYTSHKKSIGFFVPTLQNHPALAGLDEVGRDSAPTICPDLFRSKHRNRSVGICRGSIILTAIFLFFCSLSYAFDKTITIPAEKSEGVVLELPAGEYTAEISSGAISLFFPIHPNYQWIWGLAIGTDVNGGQDSPNIGTLYFEPKEKVFTQTEAEESALKAKSDRQTGTSLSFSLKENKEVRFWVSDFDYSDNSGSEKVRIYTK